MRNRSLVLAAALLALTSPVAAQGGHADFTGTWVLDASKSVIDGSMAAPASATYVVVQTGDSIAVDQRVTGDQGEMTLKKVWRVDGKTWTNYMSYQGTDMTLSSVLKWNGAVLAIHTTTDFQGTPVTQDETWTLAADGKTLTHATTTNVNETYFAAVTLVFSKK